MTKGAEFARHYGLDWLRIAAFLLLILYHIGLYFSPWHWLVNAAEPLDWVSYPMLFLTPWRLTLLFIVSGYASQMLLRKLGGVSAFTRQRTFRLIIPLLFGMAVIIPPQSWVRLQVAHGYDAGFFDFWLHDYFRFGRLYGVELPEWEHLWFVAYLWAYTMLLAAGFVFLPAPIRDRARAWFATLGDGARLLWLPLAIFIPLRIVMTFTVTEAHGLFDDWTGHAMYLPAFLFGFGLAATPTLWPAIARLWKYALALALVAYATLAWVEALYPGDAIPPHGMMTLNRAALVMMMWSMPIMLLRLADVWLNRDHRWRARLSEAVFPVYILHETSIVLIGWWLLPLHLGHVTDFVIMLAGTIASCWAFYEVGRRISWLRPLIGLGTNAPARRPVSAVDHVAERSA